MELPEGGRIELTANDLIVGVKLNENGIEEDNARAKTTEYLDVSGMGSPITITTDGNTSGVRIA